MAWQTDHSPIDYLKRRVKYYKGKVRGQKRMKTEYSLSMVNYFGGFEKYYEQLNNNIAHYNLRIQEYEDAIKILERR